MYLRILVLIWFINPNFVQYLWWKMLLLSAIGFFMVIGIPSRKSDNGGNEETALQNPFEIRPAMVFGLFFVGLAAITVLAQQAFGKTGLLVLSFITGVSDIDPFILSLVNQAASVEVVFVSAIIIAAMSNTLVKGIYFALISKQMQKITFMRFGVWALLHIPFILI
jgi:uncharacterized membrane protein (DUF4010 family)